MEPILAGIETEYGLLVDGHGAEDQVEDATALVRDYPGECFVGWDYRYESPRADLRGFVLDRLQADPEDTKFDVGRARGRDFEVRADRVLPNGARFYNDHGHPEYATPECWSLHELALNDAAGELVVLRAARAFADNTGQTVRIYKNNTDFHGASYGTHENYLVPRRLGFQELYQALLPMLVVRQILCGAGKVGSESGKACVYQISQRADFFVEPANAETLFRRPIFNTRDEPHADPREWTRLHVICGDACMMASATARKTGLVKLALRLCLEGSTPVWKLKDPVGAFQNISRDETYGFKIELEGNRWTTASEIFESYFSAAERALKLEPELCGLISECRELLRSFSEDPKRLARNVDWAAKKAMLEHYMEEEGCDWRDPSLRSFDLEYHNIDRNEGLFWALAEMGEVESPPASEELESRLLAASENTRAFARGLSVSKFKDSLTTVCWRSMTFDVEGDHQEIDLPPESAYPAQLAEAGDVGSFIKMLRGEQ